jgi:hypothetical protein
MTFDVAKILSLVVGMAGRATVDDGEPPANGASPFPRDGISRDGNGQVIRNRTASAGFGALTMISRLVK